MRNFVKPPRKILVLLVVLIVISLFAGCASVGSGNTNNTVETTIDTSIPQPATNSTEGKTEPTTTATTDKPTETSTTEFIDATSTSTEHTEYTVATEAPTAAPATAPTTKATTETTVAPTTKPTTKPATVPQKETTPSATNSTEPTSVSSNNRKTLYGYNTTTGRTVPEEIVWDHAGYADLDKLIAWDGVSPLIFIYSDGTVGTEPREGAQYESKPYILTKYVIYRDASGRAAGEICEFCGKEVEAVFHGPKNRVDYCTHGAFGHYCTYCGKWVESYTCHNCIDYFDPIDGVFYCSECGKVSGDGSNGTCRKQLVPGEHICSACGETIQGFICHTCNED